jgi:Flp pilus assembly protein TadB
MRIVASLLAGASVALVVSSFRPPDLGSVVGRYLAPAEDTDLPRTRRVSDVSWVPWVVAGVIVGLLIAQGDMLSAGVERPPLLLGLLGGASGWILFSVRRTNARERRSRSFRLEVPVLADALALHVVSGESVSSAILYLVESTDGVGSEELASVLGRIDDGAEMGLAESLMTAAATTAHEDGRRLYELLAHAHVSGGRLADALIELASDLRSEVERDLTAESGRRMVATYGPVLMLMVPTALVFLLYPTLVGLRVLAGTP